MPRGKNIAESVKNGPVQAFFGHFEKNSRPKRTQASFPEKLKQTIQKLNVSPTRTNFFSNKVHNVIDFALKLVQTEYFLLIRQSKSIEQFFCA